ncbi:MAG: hypothetical protein IJY42_03960 [Clostridia bacterium]|nr:hypothetical protein [Clostridia bacterium]
MKRRLVWSLFLFLLLGCFGLTASAAELSLPEEFEQAVETLPDGVADYLPDSFLTEEGVSEEAMTQLTSPQYLLSVVTELLGISLGGAWKLMAAILAFLVLCSFLRETGSSLENRTLCETLRLCSVGGLFLLTVGTLVGHTSEIGLYFERLNAMMRAMIPVTGTVWAMGGNVSTAAAGTASLYSFLAVCESLCAKSLLPLIGISTSLLLCNLALPDMGTGSFLSAVKKIYTVGSGLVMTLLVASLATQTAVGTAADSTGAKAAKFVSATVIPVVGGSVGDTLRSVASSITYVKSVVGVSGILFVALLVLPVFLDLLVTRLLFLLGSGAADLLGCEREGKLLSEVGIVYGMMIAVVAMTAVMFIFSFVIFLQTAVAIG